MTDNYVYSVKQIEMFINCPRKWAGHYLFGLEQFQTDNGAFGADVHNECARIGRGLPLENPDSKAGALARAMTQHVPGLGSAFVLEEIDFKVRINGTIFSLRGDVVDYANHIFFDYKTTGAQRKSDKLENGKFWTLQTLEHDVQANVYAGCLIFDDGMAGEWPGPWKARWIYGSKKFGPGGTPKCWTIDHEFTRGAVEAYWDSYIWPAVRAMRELRQAHAEKLLDSFIDVPHDWESCERSGKFCDIAGRCRDRKSEVTLTQLGIKHPERKR